MPKKEKGEVLLSTSVIGEKKMKSYELIIQRPQPSCGGKSPYKSEILSVTTDDPVAYVRKLEPESTLEVEEPENGVFLIRAENNGKWVKYEFSED